MNRILRVDMQAGKAAYHEVPEDDRLLGGRVLTSRIVAWEVEPGCHPLGPANKLVIAPGLLAGTSAPSSGRISIGAKSPLTGGIKESNGGGVVAGKLARLGIKAVVVEGRPAGGKLFLLLINRQGVQLLPADDLREVGVYEAASRLRERYGKKVGVLLIGPAGERLMSAAGITNTDVDGIPSRYCGRGGLGAVMGSKGLKAVVVDDAGCEPPALQDPKAFHAAVREVMEVIRETPQTAEVYPEYGTAAMVAILEAMGGLPTHNFRTGHFEQAEAIGGERLRETILARGGQPTHACMPGCPIRCSNIYHDAGGRVLVSPLEYETIGLFGSNCEIGDLDKIAELNRLCNDYGVDTIETGGAVAITMEAGLVPFGDADGAIRLVEEIGKGSIMGMVLGQGGAVTGRVLGVTDVPAVKGQIMPSYDPRAVKGLGVTYATSPMGADHTAGNTVRARIDQRSPAGQVEVSRNAQINATIYDYLGMCLFVGPAVKTRLELLEALVNARYGAAWSTEDLRRVALETLQTELAFNRAAGFGPADDRLPEYMTRQVNPASGTVFDVPAEELDGLFGR
ncbi:MAG: aldehyde ferredoxin oxidoreductase [Firmicutes bacterium]|nr:aldehyde ferredoxin oxidoreductase [Bacillota bacterium]